MKPALMTMPAWGESALVLLAHGSTSNRQSRLPADFHAGLLRQRGLFAHVEVAFWKEPVFYHEVLERIEVDHVYLVPFFISEGYYTKEVIPSAFGMTGRVTQQSGKFLYYCDPAGCHPAMTRALLAEIQAVLAGSVPQGETLPSDRELDVLLVGHGTPRNRKSTEAIRKQVERLKGLDRFGFCGDCYMEEAPWVADWDRLTPGKQVVAVPYFIADGLHSYEDIPRLMGLSGETAFPVPAELRGKRLWYGRSIGHQAEMEQVILDLVRDFHPLRPFCTSCPERCVVESAGSHLIQ
ncbi:MAG: CbiX/SirB N-terminal domain-containing protein [Candidatus Methylacidiphilales bacterium]